LGRVPQISVQGECLLRESTVLGVNEDSDNYYIVRDIAAHFVSRVVQRPRSITSGQVLRHVRLI
jgi:hypothetical protein